MIRVAVEIITGLGTLIQTRHFSRDYWIFVLFCFSTLTTFKIQFSSVTNIHIKRHYLIPFLFFILKSRKHQTNMGLFLLTLWCLSLPAFVLMTPTYLELSVCYLGMLFRQNINPISPNTLKIPKGKGLCFNTKSYVLKTLRVH